MKNKVMIQMVSGTFGWINGSVIERKTAESTPFAVDEKTADRLVGKKVAKIVIGSVQEDSSKGEELGVEAVSREKLQRKTVAELKEICSELQLDVPAAATKSDIIGLLLGSNEEEEDPADEEPDGEAATPILS